PTLRSSSLTLLPLSQHTPLTPLPSLPSPPTLPSLLSPALLSLPFVRGAAAPHPPMPLPRPCQDHILQPRNFRSGLLLSQESGGSRRAAAWGGEDILNNVTVSNHDCLTAPVGCQPSCGFTIC